MDFREVIETERKRLREQLETIQDDIKRLTAESENVKRELSALDAYDKAKHGIIAKRAPRSTSMRAQVVALLQSNPMKRGDIIDALGVKGDKGKEQSVSNTLATMKKSGAVTLTDGVYSLT